MLQTGDIVRLDVPNRTLEMHVDDSELALRKERWTAPKPNYERGFGWFFSRHVRQADDGCDFDFLETDFGAPVAEPPIY